MFHHMKQGYGMYLFLLSWYFISRTTDIHYLPIMAHFQNWVIFKFVAGHELSNFCGSVWREMVGFFSTEKHTVWPYSVTISSSWFLYSLMTSASWPIMMLTEQKSACPSFCYKKCKKKKYCRWSAFTSKYIAQKMKGKQYVPLERKKNPVSHLRFGTHPHITSMIYINS